jgi:hypothetical protein
VSNPDGVGLARTGGASGPHMIIGKWLPRLTSFAYGSLVAAPGSGAYAVANAGQTQVGDWPLVDGSGNPIDGVGQQPLPFPPFYALMMLMFVGYA